MDIYDLKDYIIGAKEVAKRIDEDDISFSYKSTPLIFDWKSEGFKIEYIIINDIFNWLCYLGLGDGVIVDEEVDFINYCLNLNFTKENLKKLAISKKDNDFNNHIPVSFILFCEAEIVYKDQIINHSVPVYSENLFRLFGALGQSFIACDDEVTTDEENIFEEQINLLWQKLNDFKAKRGITSTYDNLVGENISKQDITILTDLNKKTNDKMNLVLKLISQGYSFYDFDNIAFVSTDIVAKWFYKGRLGHKNFKEFYSKCIKLNPLLEIEFDKVIEHINLDDIDAEILVESKKNNIKRKSNLEPKNYIYKDYIIKLMAHFQFKEKNTRKLIEKCFPAPQITNIKFNDDVDNCSRIFLEKYENTMLILESADVDSTKLDDEIKSNMAVLKEINDKLNLLHEELLISISKSGNSDVEILLEEMGRLIDSVKEY